MTSSTLLGVVSALGFIATVQAQTSPSPGKADPGTRSETYTGCVSKVAHVDDAYVIATANRCLLLGGTFKATDLLNKTVTLRGTVTDATGRLPATLHVQSTAAVKESCTKTCTLPPPGTRGLHGSEKPGSEGGTPGVTSPPHPESP